MCIISSLSETTLHGQANNDKTYQLNALVMVLNLFNEELKSRVGSNIQYVIHEGKLSLITDSVKEDVLEICDISTFEVTTTGLRIICKQPFRVFILTYNQVCCV